MISFCNITLAPRNCSTIRLWYRKSRSKLKHVVLWSTWSQRQIASSISISDLFCPSSSRRVWEEVTHFGVCDCRGIVNSEPMFIVPLFHLLWHSRGHLCLARAKSIQGARGMWERKKEGKKATSLCASVSLFSVTWKDARGLLNWCRWKGYTCMQKTHLQHTAGNCNIGECCRYTDCIWPKRAMSIFSSQSHARHNSIC